MDVVILDSVAVIYGGDNLHLEYLSMSETALDCLPFKVP